MKTISFLPGRVFPEPTLNKRYQFGNGAFSLKQSYLVIDLFFLYLVVVEVKKLYSCVMD
jgi:hypothetical protein